MNRRELADTAALAAAQACAARGCTCIPDEHIELVGAGVLVVDIRHEPDCPAIAPRRNP